MKRALLPLNASGSRKGACAKKKWHNRSARTLAYREAVYKVRDNSFQLCERDVS